MKRGIRLLIFLALLAGLFGMPAGRALAQDQDGGGAVELIVQAEEGSVDDVANRVEALGGTVKIRYRNVPALAVTLPAGQVSALSTTSGVLSLAKDRLVYPAGPPDQEKDLSNPGAFAVLDSSAANVKALDLAAIQPEVSPEGYANFIYTNADLTWEETAFGEGTIVAVVDTGTVPNVCLAHAVTGAPGFPEGYNATGDGVSPIDPSNYYHGTFVGGVIASSCALDFSAAPEDPLYQAVSAYLPWPVDFVPIVGQAPLAQLYPVKVFDTTGAGSSTSIILDGLDHVLTLKKDGLLDIDIVNMSLGGPTIYDGRDVFDLFLKELFDAGILVVSSIGNDGSIPNSPGRPGTSLFSLGVGALDYAPSSRVFYEYLGLAYGVDGEPFNGDEGPGMGLVMRPTEETRVANFSGRGPTSDGRGKPDISALGTWNFHAGPLNELFWATGTSASSPTVAGVAALLNAYQETVQGHETNPLLLFNALLVGANPNVVGEHWRDFNDQGFGAVDAAASLERLQNHDVAVEYPVQTGKLAANVLGTAERDQRQRFSSGPVTLRPSETYDAVFDITRYTSKVTIEIYDIVTPDNSDRAYWPNALEVHVQDARRTGVEHRLAFYWYPYFFGKSFTIEITDGAWFLDGEQVAYAPMQPGLMKVSLLGDYSNESPVQFKMRITRENFRKPLQNPVFSSEINQGDVFVIPVDIPAGTSQAIFDLEWDRDWRKYPTSDIDMLIFNPAFELVSVDGATLNAPERVVIDNPTPGEWYVYIEGFEMYRRDTVRLFVTLE